jgi:hypothetical protein
MKLFQIRFIGFCARKACNASAAKLIGIALLACVYSNAHAEWQADFDFSPFDHSVADTAIDSDGNIYLIGDFLDVNGIANTAGLVKWDVSEAQFESVGGFSKTSEQLATIAIDNADNIYVGGKFIDFNGMADANALVRYDSTAGQWEAVGLTATLSTQVFAIEFDESSGDIYLGGEDFGANNLAKWTDSDASWDSFGSGSPAYRDIYALCFVNGILYVGGDYGALEIDGDDEYIGAYDTVNETWSSLAEGVQRDVRAIEYLASAGASGSLVIAGEFSTVYDMTNSSVSNTRGIARWDIANQAWSAIGGGIPSGEVTDIVLSGSATFVIGGTFPSVLSLDGGGISTPVDNTNAIARYSGGAWESVASGTDVDSEVISLLSLSSTDLLVVGRLWLGGSNQLASASVVESNSWETPYWGSASGAGIFFHMDGFIETIVTDAEGNFYVAGDFNEIGGVRNTRNIAKWNGTSWEAVGIGVDGDINDMAIDESGNLYIGGDFVYEGEEEFDAGGLPEFADFIAMWDGTQWLAVGEGFSAPVYVIEIDDKNDLVYAGGDFEYEEDNNLAVNKISVWNGTQWSAMGGGLNGEVYALSLGVNGDLYVGGSFDENEAGTKILRNLALWNGTEWAEVGMGVDSGVEDLVFDDGRLYVAGDFAIVDNSMMIEYESFAIWDGSAWSTYAGLSDQYISDLLIDSNGDLIVGGEIEEGFNNIARWDGNAWISLGSGLNNSLDAMADDGDGNLFVGGSFSTAGGIRSSRIAHWQYEAGCSFFSIPAENGSFAVICL